jgi:hypothetical protein
MRDSHWITLSYARRQQWRRLMTAASRAAGAAIALVAAALATAAEEAELGLLLALLSGVLALASHHSLRLAARSRVGAESEAQVRRALEPLAREAWLACPSALLTETRSVAAAGTGGPPGAAGRSARSAL